MEKRFTRIGTMSAVALDGCPVRVKEVTLWRDGEHDVLFFAPSIQNEYNAPVSSFVIGYEAMNASEEVKEKESGYRIDEVNEEDGCFGQDIPVTLQCQDAVSGRFYIEQITFADGYTWSKKEENEKQEEAEDETAEVTMIKTVGGFGPDGATFRKIPLSAIIAQRTMTQFITTILAVIVCVFSLANCIAFVGQSDEKIADQLVDLVVEAEMEGLETDEEVKSFISENNLVDVARDLYIIVAVLMGVTILFKLYVVFFLRETRSHLKKNVMKDTELTTVVKRMNILSIVQLVLSVLCNFNFFGIFASISGLSVASLHRRIMKTKEKHKPVQM